MALDAERRIVSSDDELLILVDQDDNEAGHLSKAHCHDGDGVLHRAFSVFLFNEAGELLLQRRGDAKRLWPGYWSNSCCSHPRKGESLEIATLRRLQDELGTTAELEFAYKFTYQARYGESGAEHELCWVFLGRLNGEANANPTEIGALRFVSAAELAREFAESADSFTPWFVLEWQELNEQHGPLLSRYMRGI